DVVDEEVVDEEDAEEGENLGYEDPKFYTLNDYLDLSPSNWNPLTWENNTDSSVLQLVTSELYAFDFNPEDPGEGYIIVPEMAAGMPEDITADYAGDPKWNVPEGATEGYVYRIPIKDNLKWDDGTPITADTFIYSAQQLLDPRMQNRRADEMYETDRVVTRARDYIYQGLETQLSVANYAEKNEFEDVDAFLAEHGDDAAKINWAEAFGQAYDAENETWVDGEAEYAVVDAGMNFNELRDLFIDKYVNENEASEEEAIEAFNKQAMVDYTYPEISWDEVGIQKEDDHTIVYFLDNKITGIFFYMYSNIPLVKEDVYESCKVEKEGEELVTTTYCTSLDKTPSYGPYVLTKFQDDKVLEFERNENWYGYSDGEHKGKYQTDKVVYTIVKEPATRLQMFLKGQLDAYSLTADQVGDYRGSDFILYTPGSFTNSLLLQANKEALEARQEPGYNKTILTLKNFRKALALSVDRADFAASVTASSIAGFGLLNDYYIADPDTMLRYRDLDDAKRTLVDAYAMEYGEDKEFKTLDEAISAMTGYDLEQARDLFNQAFDEAVETGLMKEDDKVQLTYHASEDNEVTRKYYNYLKTNWEKAVKGTKLEGKFILEFDPTDGQDFANNFKRGLSDMTMAGWSGAWMNPYFLMTAYLDDNLRYAQQFDTNQKLTIEIDGKEITLTLNGWYAAMNAQDPEHPYGPNDTSLENRVRILAAMEKVVMEDYTTNPMISSTSASLKSQKVEFFTDKYNLLMGRGAGVDYRTYNFSDEEWEEYVKEQGGELDYK
ncbi:MAG: ABC transporter substrate-binding protein, partial [Eubacteriales bacterium]|nr:ABC transporter substrate-binding protein [Eubacteriales bacterium]